MNFDYREEGCFVCGGKNMDGLRLKFKHFAEGRSEVRCVFEDRHQGYDGVVHGGILAAVLDDTMAHAIMATGPYAITAEMKIRYRKPAPMGEEILFEGKLVKTGKRFSEAGATAKDLDGEILAEASGVFAVTFGNVNFDMDIQ